MKALATIGFLITILAAGAGDVVAAKHGWVRLGDRTVTDRSDHDVFVIKGPKRELFALKLAVRKHPVEIDRIRITFADGSTQEHRVNAVIPAGGASRVIDLAGRQRTVTKVEFWYDAQSRGGKAVVRLLGRT